MSLTLNNKATKLRISGIREFSNQLVDYPNALNLTIGQPDFPTPEAVKQAGIQAIENNKTAYSSNAGLLELRQVVATYFKERYNCQYEASEVLITNGATQAIDAVLRTIIEPGDEIILSAPMYSGYIPMIEYAGATPVFLDITETNFEPDVEALKALMTPKTKAIMLNFPSNPTGATLSHERMDELVAFLKEEDVYLISDEIYSEITFEGEHRSFGSYPELKEKMFLISGLSKSHSMTGWRIGFILASEALIDTTVKINAFNILCAAVPSQYAAIEALTGSKDAPLPMRDSYKERRDYIYGRLVEMGIDVHKPNGAFYIFPSIKQFGMTSHEFATRLLKEAGVCVVPGSVFASEGYLRITYAYAFETLVEAMDRLEQFVTKVRAEQA